MKHEQFCIVLYWDQCSQLNLLNDLIVGVASLAHLLVYYSSFIIVGVIDLEALLHYNSAISSSGAAV